MEVMLSSSTVQGCCNAYMRVVDGDDSKLSSCEDERRVGLFGSLLEQIAMAGCKDVETASKVEVDSEDVRLVEQDSDETEDNAVPWYSALIYVTWLSQNVAAVASDVEQSTTERVSEPQVSETDSLIGGVDVQVPIGIALEHKVAAPSGAGFEAQMDTELSAFDEAIQIVNTTDVTVRNPDEHKREAFAVSTSEQGFIEKYVNAQEEHSNGTFPVPEAHKALKLHLQALEEDMELEEEPFGDAPSDMRENSNSSVFGENHDEISGQYLHKGIVSVANESSESVEPKQKPADKQYLSFVPPDGAPEINRQENLISSTVQVQIDEVRQSSVPEQIIESVRYLKYDKTKEFDIELVPKELGRVHVSVTTDGERLSVHLVAENSSVAEVIKAELPVLRDVLAGQGLMFGELNVGVGQDGGTFGSAKYRAEARSAYTVKRLGHTGEDDLSHHLSRSDGYGPDMRLHVDYVA